MSLFSTIWNTVIGWLSPVEPSPNNDGHASTPPRRTASAPPREPPVGGKFDAIQVAVEQTVAGFVRNEVRAHRAIAPEDFLELHFVEIETSPEGERLLNAFFHDFSKNARQKWIKRLIGHSSQIDLSYFVDIVAKDGVPESDTLDRHAQALATGARPDYLVELWGHWRSRSETTPEKASASAGHFEAQIGIHDADGQRQESIADFPATIGRNGQCQIVVLGTFVSGEHCVLDNSEAGLSVTDCSRNGTWLDGEKLRPEKKIKLTIGTHDLRLGLKDGEPKDGPELRIVIGPRAFEDGNSQTPLATDAVNTPIVPSSRGPLLAVLVIQDATGEPRKDVISLPFRIGRHAGQDYVTPAEHAGVSGEHLVIKSISENGAEVVNLAAAKNGTAMNGDLQGDRFLWPFDAEIVLAAKWTKDPAVRLVLKPPR